MKILGIDTSAKVCSSAVISGKSVLSFRTVSDGMTHSETLLPAIKAILKEADTKLKELDGIAVSHGPGSFTGLRIGISTVKGLAVSQNIPCIGVSTLEALAMNCIESEGAVICPVMDARRGEFYNALFQVKNGNLIRLCEDRAIPGLALAKEICGDEKVLILGDGAEKFIQQNPAFSENIVSHEARYQSGASVALLGLQALQNGSFQSCKEISPRYLRLPQAEREWNEKHK